MIELDDTKVLRFTYEEIRRLRSEHSSRVDEGVDWFATLLMREYPDMSVIAKTHDPATDLVWVIMRKDYPLIENTVFFDDLGNMAGIDENLLN